MFEWAAQDRHTKVVCSYIETMRDVAGIEKGLKALAAAHKPVLVCAPAGRSEAALRSIVAHTGALAGNTGVRDAWLRGLGVVLVEDPVIMFEAALLIGHHKKTRSTGVTAALQSGGACTLFAEAVGAEGLDLPQLAKATERRLKAALPSFANLNNPLDVTGQAAVETDMYCDAIDALAHDPSIGFIGIDAFPPRGDDEHDVVWALPVLDRAKELEKETGVTFASISMTPLKYMEGARAFIKRVDMPFLQGHRAAAGAVRALMDNQGTKAATTTPLAAHANRAKAVKLLKGLVGPLDEEQAARILEWYGVKRPKEKLVETPAQSVAFAKTLKGPVAVKAAAPEIPHKAKLGGVKLNLTTSADVEVAAADVLAAAKKAGAKAPKVLVQEMASGAEILIGAIVDHQFGPAITIRPGGALAEAGGATFVAAPLSAKQALAFVESQAERCRLDPTKHDLRAVAHVVQSIAHAASDLRGRITSLEANPLLVGKKGAVAVDALAEARP
jgi:acyl-CoA synthetase (NDP forming)